MQDTNVQPNPVIMTEEDYNLLKPLVGRLANKDNEMSLAYEINRAVVVKKEAFPQNAVKLNTKVSIMDMGTEKVMHFTIVMPEHADMKQGRISVLTPMGAALIGFRKGEEVQWKVPAGMKRFRILDVAHMA